MKHVLSTIIDVIINKTIQIVLKFLSVILDLSCDLKRPFVLQEKVDEILQLAKDLRLMWRYSESLGQDGRKCVCYLINSSRRKLVQKRSFEFCAILHLHLVTVIISILNIGAISCFRNKISSKKNLQLFYIITNVINFFVFLSHLQKLHSPTNILLLSLAVRRPEGFLLFQRDFF